MLKHMGFSSDSLNSTHFLYQKTINGLEPKSWARLAERLCLSAVGRESASSSCKSLQQKNEEVKRRRWRIDECESIKWCIIKKVLSWLSSSFKIGMNCCQMLLRESWRHQDPEDPSGIFVFNLLAWPLDIYWFRAYLKLECQNWGRTLHHDAASQQLQEQETRLCKQTNSPHGLCKTSMKTTWKTNDDHSVPNGVDSAWSSDIS